MLPGAQHEHNQRRPPGTPLFFLGAKNTRRGERPATSFQRSGWTLRSPAPDDHRPGNRGLQITSTTQFNENSTLYGGEPLVTATCMPSDAACSGAGTTQYIYYTGGTLFGWTKIELIWSGCDG